MNLLDDFPSSAFFGRRSSARPPRWLPFAAAVLIAVVASWPGGSAAQEATPTPTVTPAPTAVPEATPSPVLTREQRLEQRKIELRALVEQRKTEVAAQMGVEVQPPPAPAPAPQLVGGGVVPVPTPVSPIPRPLQPVVPGGPEALKVADGEPPPDPADLAGLPTPPGAPDMVMMLKPYRQKASVGQRFSTDVVLSSEAGGKVDSLRVCITYPRDSVRVVKVYDYPLATALDGDNPPSLTNEAGLLTYEADLARPIPLVGSLTVLYVVWEAVEEEAAGALLLSRYNLGEDHQSSVMGAGRNMLKSSTASGVSCVNAEVRIGPAADASGSGSTRPAMGFWQKLAPPEGPAADTPASNVRLEIRPPDKAPAVGDRFVLDVFVDDPLFAPFDEVRLAIGFDPKKAQVLDWDYHNWIRSGVNVFDGHAHEMFPFNVHTRNQVDNEHGRINYQMGSTKAGARPSGCLVRIHAKALAAGAAESFTLWPKGQTVDWSTDIRLRNESVLEGRKDESGKMKSKVTISKK